MQGAQRKITSEFDRGFYEQNDPLISDSYSLPSFREAFPTVLHLIPRSVQNASSDEFILSSGQSTNYIPSFNEIFSNSLNHEPETIIDEDCENESYSSKNDQTVISELNVSQSCESREMGSSDYGEVTRYEENDFSIPQNYLTPHDTVESSSENQKMLKIMQEIEEKPSEPTSSSKKHFKYKRTINNIPIVNEGLPSYKYLTPLLASNVDSIHVDSEITNQYILFDSESPNSSLSNSPQDNPGVNTAPAKVCAMCYSTSQLIYYSGSKRFFKFKLL